MVFWMNHFNHAGQRADVQWCCQVKAIMTKHRPTPLEGQRQQSGGLCAGNVLQKGILN